MRTAQFAGDNRQALAGTAQCGNCKGPMVRVGPNYACAAGLAQEWHPCYQNAINADRLLKVVMDSLMGLVMTCETVDSVVNIIKSQTAEASRRERQHLDHTEDALDRLRDREATLNDDPSLTNAENQETELPDDVQEQLRELDNNAIALEYEARRSSKELEGLEFVGDEKRLRANALNLENYRRPDHSEQTARIVRMFIESVEVTPEAVLLNFTMPIPTDDEPEGTLSTVIPL